MPKIPQQTRLRPLISLAGLLVASATYADSITITYPVVCESYNVDAITKQADIGPIIGTYIGSPGGLEACWDTGAGCSYVAVSGAIGGGNYTGALPAQQGFDEGTLHVRFTSNHSIEATVGPILLTWVHGLTGQSNDVMQLVNHQTYTAPAGHPTWKACSFNPLACVPGFCAGHPLVTQWEELADPMICDGTRPTCAGAATQGKGSVWPLIATRLAAEEAMPFAAVQCGSGGTTSDAWRPGGAEYGNCVGLIKCDPRSNPFCHGFMHGVHDWWHNQGEADTNTTPDCGACGNQAQYQGNLRSTATGIAADLNGAKLMVTMTDAPASAMPGLDAIRAGQQAEWDLGLILPGATTYDIGPLCGSPCDGVHYTSDAQAAVLTGRIGDAIEANCCGGGDARGPRWNGPAINGNRTKIAIPFIDATSPILPASGLTLSGWSVTDNAINAPISSIARTANDALTVTLSSPASTLGPHKITYASGATLNGEVAPGNGKVVLKDSAVHPHPADIAINLPIALLPTWAPTVTVPSPGSCQGGLAGVPTPTP